MRNFTETIKVFESNSFFGSFPTIFGVLRHIPTDPLLKGFGILKINRRDNNFNLNSDNRNKSIQSVISN